MKFSALQIREIFHLEFLRELVKKIPASTFILKGGSNLRFFFQSIRYSEDMELDADGISVEKLKQKSLEILDSKPLLSRLRTFGIDELIPPDMKYAKQTKTVQRFKVHLITSAGEDLFTKIEFSRRGFDSPYRVEAIGTSVLGVYQLPPLIIPHYLAESAAKQKINAVRSRRWTEARDIFDLYILSSQIPDEGRKALKNLSQKKLREAQERIYAVDYEQYQNQVVSFFLAEDQAHYRSRKVWDEIRLTALSLIDFSAFEANS